MHNLTYTERERIAYAEGKTELAELLAELAEQEIVVEALEDEIFWLKQELADIKKTKEK